MYIKLNAELAHDSIGDTEFTRHLNFHEFKAVFEILEEIVGEDGKFEASDFGPYNVLTFDEIKECYNHTYDNDDSEECELLECLKQYTQVYNYNDSYIVNTDYQG